MLNQNTSIKRNFNVNNVKKTFNNKRSNNKLGFNTPKYKSTTRSVANKAQIKKNYNFRAKIQAKIQRLFRKRKNIKSRSLFYLQRRARDKELKLKRDLQTGLFGFFNR